ncbi:PANK2 [Symbiodinium sp. KB8]|nr:PANK2 [Symbiodinium sp. KB8]
MKTPEGEYSFLRFESRWMDDFLAILQKLDFPASEVRATGGGAFKVRNLLPAARVADECALLPAARLPLMPMDALVKGLRFCQQANPDEVFWYDLEQPEPGGKLPWASWTGGQAETPSAQESALVVNIGSGVSVLKVQAPGAASSPTPVQRISGCSVGGATFWGLARLLTRVRSFDEAVELAGAGDNTRVAMLVKDIYGGEYGKLGLPDGLVAADFGKMSTVDEIVITEQGGAPVGHIPPTSSFMARSFSQPPPIDIHGAEPALPNASSPASATITRSHIASEADLTRGLLVLVLNNIAQVAYLNAKAEGVDRIFFTGGFLREGIMVRLHPACPGASRAPPAARPPSRCAC